MIDDWRFAISDFPNPQSPIFNLQSPGCHPRAANTPSPPRRLSRLPTPHRPARCSCSSARALSPSPGPDRPVEPSLEPLSAYTQNLSPTAPLAFPANQRGHRLQAITERIVITAFQAAFLPLPFAGFDQVLEAARPLGRRLAAFRAPPRALHPQLIFPLPRDRQVRELIMNRSSHSITYTKTVSFSCTFDWNLLSAAQKM